MRLARNTWRRDGRKPVMWEPRCVDAGTMVSTVHRPNHRPRAHPHLIIAAPRGKRCHQMAARSAFDEGLQPRQRVVPLPGHELEVVASLLNRFWLKLEL